MPYRSFIAYSGAFCAVTLTAGGLFAATWTLNGVQDDDLRKAIEGGSLLAEQTAEDADPSQQELLAAAQADYKRLLAVMYDRGYYGAVIKITLDGVDVAGIAPVNPPSSTDRAVITVTPGPQFKFGKAQIAPVAQGTEIPEEFATGQVAGLAVLKSTVSAGVDGWRAQGHAKAELERQDLVARHPLRQLDADLRLAPGPQLRFGPVIITGNTAMRNNRIEEIAGVPEGTVFDPEALDMAAKRLRRTGVFSSVSLSEADKIAANNTLPITIQVAEAKPRRFGFGADVSTNEGVGVEAFWLHRNLWGGGERFRIEGTIEGIGGSSGGEDYRLSARFDRPATFNEDTDFFTFATLEQLDEVAFFSRQLDVVAGIKRYATEKRTYEFGLGVRTAETRDAFGTNRYTLLTVPLSAKFDYRDEVLDAKDGYYANVALIPFLSIDGADNGMRSYVDVRGYKTFGTTRPVTLALRGQLGSVYGPDLSVAPADYLFYSGGGGTVRGQPYQSLGVDLGGGNVTGGRSFIGLSAELRVQVTDKIGVVGFADGGYIGAEEFYDGSGVWQSGAGLGLRYATGIGPIRLDVAVPTSGPDTGENVQVYIGIGQSF